MTSSDADAGAGRSCCPRRHRADHGRHPHRAPGRATCWWSTTGSPRSAQALDVPEGTQEIDATRRHRDAGHDRHPPAHVADRDARVRRRLDADPVLRLVLPRARQDVPPRGHPRRQPALGLGRARGRRDHHRRLVARPADRRPRRGRGRRAARRCPAGSCSPTATSRPARGSGRPTPPCRAFLERPRRGERPARRTARLRRHRRPGVPGEGGLRGRPRARPAGDHPRRGLGRHQRRRHPADARERLHDAGDRLRARGHAEPPTPTSGSPRPAARSRSRRSPSRAPARATRPPGSCASTASRCRCRWTPACGGAATCSPRCGRRSAPTGRASTWRRTPRATP